MSLRSILYIRSVPMFPEPTIAHRSVIYSSSPTTFNVMGPK